jgi:hypothetical protein
VSAGGYLALKAQWTQTPEWRRAPAAYRALALPPKAAGPREARARSSDREVVRAHTEWISALHLLFGDPAKRLPTETVLTQLDTVLAH